MILKLYPQNNQRADVQRVVDVLERGGVIVYPTDTLYAIGCHGLQERAIEKVAQLKGLNTRKQLLSVTCHSIQQASQFAKIDNQAFKLMKRYLPGPYTFILPAMNKLPKIFKNRKEVGIRIPNSPILEVVEMLEAPILSSTVPYKINGDIEYLTDPELIAEAWGEQVDLVIDGGIGGVQASTIVDCTDGTPIVVREGAGEWYE
ncbi:MAG TPA: L-threonylcarbamoyladenylate synthase [Bacteroidaceae bacterium]|nr:L-threonylcarbamoyladenylate synthase [Bacteroidaceae bacterium]